MIAKNYHPADFERRLYEEWEEKGYFRAGMGKKEGAKPFSILLPPPNVTGTLHMGHAFQHTLMDALTRYHRMCGDDVLWQAGTDHAGIATQLVVERQLEAEGKHRADLGRKAFLERVWQWKETSGSTITRQMRRIGASCDWSREKFTMDDELSKIVTEVFVRLYREGLIYRGKRLVNWDPKLKTAVSDLEVEMTEKNGQMWKILYPFSDGVLKDHEGKPLRGMTIATTRPETMLADGALCVHPDDPRYAHLVGQFVDLPLCNRKIPIIADDFVDKEFGSGCVKITGAHDFNDYQCAMKHGLELIVIMDEAAKMNDNAPIAYRGLDRYAAREAVVKDLVANDFLVGVMPHQNMVPICARTGEVVEPMLTDQWFVKMESLAEIGLKPFHDKTINFVPENWINTYRVWLENIQDWCISRQLWWGHRIPAWFDEDGRVFVAHNEEEAKELSGGRALIQDEDVLDTWFSSALWPFSTLGWNAENKSSPENMVDRYLPTSVLITGFDIIFFWVARMVMMTEHIVGKHPFSVVHITGLVRDAEGHKMSKSKGNIIDPIDLMDGISLEALLQKRTVGMMQPHLKDKVMADTKKHFSEGINAVGADALRYTFAALASHGRDIKFDHHRCEGYRNFCTKLWNATRFVLMQCEGHEKALLAPHLLEDNAPTLADSWMIGQLQRAEAECAKHFAEYRFDLLARTLFELVWNDFCDWYLEAAKIQINGDTPESQATRLRLVRVLEAILRLAHPLIPFITEELWRSVAPLMGKTADKHPTIMLEPYPVAQPDKIKPKSDKAFAVLQSLVEECRRLRSEMKLSPQTRLPLCVSGSHEDMETLSPYLVALAKLQDIRYFPTLPEKTAPVSQVAGLSLMLWVEVDEKAEKERLQKERLKLTADIDKLTGQLANPSFVERAPPAIIQQNKERLADWQQKLETVQKNLVRLQS